MSISIEEFKAWFATLDTTLAGSPPTLNQWWELKARLDAVEEPIDAVEVPSQPAAPLTDPLTPAPQAPIAADLKPGHRLCDLHDEDMPSSEFTVFEEAVQLLKSRKRA